MRPISVVMSLFVSFSNKNVFDFPEFGVYFGYSAWAHIASVSHARYVKTQVLYLRAYAL